MKKDTESAHANCKWIKLIGMSEDKINFNFKWSDDMQIDGDVMDFYKSGDVAPGGRFMYNFRNTVVEENDSGVDSENKKTRVMEDEKL